MKIPYIYIVRNLSQRISSTIMTIGAFALVIVALLLLMAMVQGIDRSLVTKGAGNRIFVISGDATTENQSRLSPQEADILGTTKNIKLKPDGDPMISSETVGSQYVSGPGGQNILINFRGVDLSDALQVHSGIRIVSGRFFDVKADNEVIIGRGVAQALDLKAGQTLHEATGNRSWIVTGIFSDNGSPFESEIWTTRLNMAINIDRNYLSSVWAVVADPKTIPDLLKRLNSQTSPSIYAMTEEQYFEAGAGTAKALQVLAWFVTVLMAIGAIFSALNTMYASVSNRIQEFGTMRAIGFGLSSVTVAILIEAEIMAFSGGILACLFALLFNGYTFSTLVVGLGIISFQLVVSPVLLLSGLALALLLGFIGGIVPARYALHMPVVESLKY